jgi:hypothetical protein
MTLTIVQAIEAKIDDKIDSRISTLQGEVSSNTESNRVLNSVISNIKLDMSQTKTEMSEQLTSTRTSIEKGIGKEMLTMRNDIKKSEDNTGKKLDQNSSKLDDLMSMFSAMTARKDFNATSGKNRELQNKSEDEISISDGKDNIMDISAFPTFPFFQSLGWRNKNGNLDNGPLIGMKVGLSFVGNVTRLT